MNNIIVRGLCAGVCDIVGEKKERKRFYLFRSNLGHPLLFFFQAHKVVHIEFKVLSESFLNAVRAL